MGLGASKPLPRLTIDQTVPVKSGKLLNDDRSATVPLRNATHPDSLVSRVVDEEINSALDVFLRGRRISGDNGFLGQRRRLTDSSAAAAGGSELGSYEWWSYNEVYRLAWELGSGLEGSGCVEEKLFPEERYVGARKLRCIGIGSRNRLEWFILEQACNLFGYTIVPLYDTLGSQAVKVMLHQTKLTCISGGELNLANYFKMIKAWRATGDAATADQVHTALSFDPLTPALTQAAKDLNIRLIYWQDLLGDTITLPPPPKRENVSTICYSSGTTGQPKGVIITHGGIASNVCACLRTLQLEGIFIDHQDTYMSYLPLAHVFERMVAHVVFSIGGKVSIYSGEARLLLEDVKMARPTIFASVPRLFMRINDSINMTLNDQSSVGRYLFHMGLETKLERLRESGSVTHSLWDRLLFNKVKKLMGSNLRYMLIGGAASDLYIQQKMSVLFCCPLLEGYGLTETLGTTFLRRGDDSLYGHIGAPLPCNEIKLVALPDMNYNMKGDEIAGELWIRGHTVTPGYFLNHEEYEENVEYEKDSSLPWFRTGDIAVRLEGGRIKIIDRRKNLFKMSQGEYISPERLEGIYHLSPILSQVFVYGDSRRNSLVAIIYISDLFVLKQGAKFGIPLESLKVREHTSPQTGNGDEDDEAQNNAPAERVVLNIDELKLHKNTVLRKRVDEELERLNQEHGLKGFEKIKNWRFGREGPGGGGFSIENGQLTPTYKYKRNLIITAYKHEFELMYKELGEWFDQQVINVGRSGTGDSPN